MACLVFLGSGLVLVALGVAFEAFFALLGGVVALVFAAAARWRKAAFAAVLVSAILVAIGAAEIALRDGPAPEPAARFSASYSGGRYFTRNDLGSAAKPGVHAIAKTAQDGTVIYDVKYSIGADGFRVTPFAAPPGARRINFFGCSYTFGEGLQDDQTLPYHVAKLGGFDVRNFGFHGWGAQQALTILKSPRDTVGAINFYLAIPWQSERSACAVPWVAGSPRYVLENGALRRDGVCGPGAGETGMLARLFPASAVARRIDDHLNQRARRDRWMALYLALLVEMHEVSKRRSQELIVGFVRSDWLWDYGSYSDDSLMAALRAKGVRVIDLSLTDAERRTDPKYKIPVDGHPSGSANEARARMIVQAIR